VKIFGVHDYEKDVAKTPSQTLTRRMKRSSITSFAAGKEAANPQTEKARYAVAKVKAWNIMEIISLASHSEDKTRVNPRFSEENQG